MSIQRLVSPKLPTALAAQANVDLPGYEIWLHNVDAVLILPAELDVPTFEEALSKALQLFPHAAGQLRCNGGRWSIELTNTAVPVDIDYKLNASSESLLNDNWVLQDDISPFLSNQPIGANLVNGGAPLLRLKLIFFNDETSIGISWHHTLGDAILLSRFMHTLSQFYQDFPPGHPIPSFKKHHFPSPPASVLAEFWPHMPHLHEICPMNELGNRIADVCKNVENLAWRFDNHDLAELRSALSSIGQEKIYLSRQDCLIAYLVTILNRNRSIVVRKVTTTCSYRNISAPFIAEDVAGNLLQNVPATVPTDMVGIATSIRSALVRCREPDYIYNWTTVAGNHMLETANEGKAYFFISHDDVVTVNSNMIIDWCSAHFGYPDGCRFYTAGDDGVWRTSQSTDISMGLTAEMKTKFVDTLSRGIPHILGSEGIQS